MYIAETKFPGTWLDHDDQEWSQDVRTLLDILPRALAEACVALTWFERQRANQAREASSDADSLREEWETETERLREIEADIREEMDVDPFDFEAQREIRRQARIRLKREKWKSGEWPQSYEHRLIFMHAKSFLHSIDRIRKTLRELETLEGVPESVEDVGERFNNAFPDLRRVRNTTAHVEDRARGLFRGEELDLKPIQNSLISAPEGAIAIENLNGNRFGSIMENGEYGEVEISAAKIEVLTDCIQSVIEAFDWRGPARHYPR
jgi:hypothetical protein